MNTCTHGIKGYKPGRGRERPQRGSGSYTRGCVYNQLHALPLIHPVAII